MAYGAMGGFPPQQLSLGKKKPDSGEALDPHRKYENHVFLVYLHINKINEHVYVGITHHVKAYKRWGYGGDKYLHCKKFYHAIKKYGWKNFEHVVLCKTSKERAILLEQTLIAHYKRLGISYNLADGGEGAEAVSEETRAKLRKIKSANPPMKGKHHTPEARAKISEAGKKRIYTEEQKSQIAKAGELGRKTMRERGYTLPVESLRRITERLSKPVLQLDLEGNILKEFPSTRVADEFINNGKRCNHIADVCNGKRKTANGYIWRYKEERRIV